MNLYTFTLWTLHKIVVIAQLDYIKEWLHNYSSAIWIKRRNTDDTADRLHTIARKS